MKNLQNSISNYNMYLIVTDAVHCEQYSYIGSCVTIQNEILS